jgi:hypothetical protein
VIVADNSDGASVGRKKKKKKLFKVKRTSIIPSGIDKELNSEIVNGPSTTEQERLKRVTSV